MEIGNKTIAQLAEELHQIPFLEGLKAEQFLDKVPFFDGVDPRVIAKVVDQALLLQFLPGQAICHQGDYEETFYVILSGEVEVTATAQNQEVLQLATLQKGDFFGEMGPLSGQPRTATVTAKTRAVVLQVPKAVFLELLRRSPEVKERIDRKYIERSLRTHLKRVSLFASLADDIIDALANKVELVSFRKGEVIIREGDPGDCLYLIRSGFVKVSRGPLDHEKILTYLQEGSYFGEMALIRDERRSANIVAMTDVEAVRIGKREFGQILSLHPEVEQLIQATMEAREKETKEISRDERKARAMSFVVSKGLAQAREILVVDLEKCINCDCCVDACQAFRGHTRIERRGSRLGRFLVPTSCFHCENPECLLCPVGGIVRDKDGEIHHTEFCNGCGGCARRCPYGNILVIKVEEGEPGNWLKKILARRPKQEQPEKKKRQLVVKCDMCGDYARMACVYNCPTGAMRVLKPEDLIEAYDKE
jgi:cGMP-dependent protein kinase 2